LPGADTPGVLAKPCDAGEALARYGPVRVDCCLEFHSLGLTDTDIGFIGLRRYKCAKNRIGFGPQGDETGFIGLRRYKCAKNRIGFGPQGDETGQ
jgi:hypothetical protein